MAHILSPKSALSYYYADGRVPKKEEFIDMLNFSSFPVIARTVLLYKI